MNARLLSTFGLISATLLITAPSPVALAQGEPREVQLSLAECLRMALENNLDLVSAGLDPRIAEQDIERNRAPFDGVLAAGGNLSDSSADSTIVDNTGAGPDADTTADRETLTGDVSFSHLLTYGGSYELSLDLSDSDSAFTQIEGATGFLTSSTSANQSESLTLSYSMPLLNGFGREVNTVNLVLARSGLEISREDLRLQAMLTLNSVEGAYWDLLAAREALRIEGLALKRARDLLELNKKKVEVGTLAPIEITQAEAGVASQEEGVILAEVALENAEDALLELLAIPDSSPMWAQPIRPTDTPSFEPVEVDLDQSIATALQRRPEMTTARQRLRDNELSERVARNGVRHGLDLTASLGPGQSDNDQRVEILFPPGTPASDTTTASDSTAWQIGLRYRYPLRNRQAKANYAIAKLTTQKTDIALRNTEQGVRVDVRAAVRNLESGLKRVSAARKNVELQEKKLEAEQKKFDNGMSTSFEVLTFQNDLASAQLAEIRARLDYLKALTAHERAKGTLLEARGLSL